MASLQINAGRSVNDSIKSLQQSLDAMGMEVIDIQEEDTELPDNLPSLDAFTEGESTLSQHVLNLLAELNRKQQIVTKISRQCTEDNIRKKYSDMEIKEITYDPSLYSVVATEALGIHRRLLKMFGTDVIRLQDPVFIENSLQIMLDKEEKAEVEATALRKKRGEESEWNAEKKALFAGEVRRMLRKTTSTALENPRRKAYGKAKANLDKKVGLLTTYNHEEHDFHIPEAKYTVNYSVWEEEEEDSVGPDHVSLMFEQADSIVTAPKFPEQGLKMKRRGCELDLTTPPLKEAANRNSRGENQKNESNRTENNNSKKWLHKGKYRKSIVSSSPSQSIFSEQMSSFSDPSTKPMKLKTQRAALKDLEEDDRSMYEPQKLKPEEKKLDKPSLDSNS